MTSRFPFDFAGRRRKAQDVLAARGLDALLVLAPEDVYSLSGYDPHLPWYPFDLHRLSPVILRAGGDSIQVAVRVNEERVRTVSTIKTVFAYDEFREDGARMVGSILEQHGIAAGRIGFDDGVVVAHTLEALRGALPRVTFVPAAELLKGLRAIKEPAEVACLRRACEIAWQGMQKAVETVAPGESELEVAAQAEFAMRRLGGERFPEETQILGGTRALRTRDRARAEYRLREGEAGILGVGTFYQGYCSDLSRTVFLGHVPDDLRRLHQLVQDVHTATMDMIRPGVTAEAIDAAARDRYAAAAPRGAHLAHIVGHGIGLAGHEISLIKPGEKRRIETGMTFTVQPSLRVPGLCAIRIEDDAVVTDTDVEYLAPPPRGGRAWVAACAGPTYPARLRRQN